jgi:hypothetical protein
VPSAQNIETRAHSVSLDAEGILHVRATTGAEIDLADCVDLIGRIAAMWGVVRRPMLVDMTGIRSVSRDARKYLSGETSQVVSAGALIVMSPLARVIGTFFLGFDRSQNPTRLFASEAEALPWLRGFLP